jgi:hypothetical protein
MYGGDLDSASRPHSWIYDACENEAQTKAKLKTRPSREARAGENLSN